MRFGPPPPLCSHLMLMGCGPSGGAGFVGALDAFTADLAVVWSVSYRLLSSYAGPLIRVRRSSDNAEQDIGFDATGKLDASSLSAFVGGSNWFLRTAYNQLGVSARNIGTSTAASQPQGAIGADSLAYVYAPNAGFTTTGLSTGLISLAATNTTHWSIGAAAAFPFDMLTIRTSAPSERRMTNYSNAIIAQVPTSGTTGQITTNTGRYSATLQVGASGHRVCNGITAGTGTKPSDSVTLNYIMVGQGGGGNFWSQNSSWLAGALWTADLGNATADAVHAAARTLFNAQ